jgi:hypothetical protein
MKKIINCETGEVIERELNAEELAQQEIDEADFAAKEAVKQAEAQTKAQAKAVLLERLGLTQEEFNTLTA